MINWEKYGNFMSHWSTETYKCKIPFGKTKIEVCVYNEVRAGKETYRVHCSERILKLKTTDLKTSNPEEAKEKALKLVNERFEKEVNLLMDKAVTFRKYLEED